MAKPVRLVYLEGVFDTDQLVRLGDHAPKPAKDQLGPFGKPDKPKKQAMPSLVEFYG